MPELDMNPLLAEISADSPSGPDLEYDDVFSEMERASQGKPEQQYGDTVIDAEEPEWSEVRKLSIQILERSRDLRAAVYLAKSSLFVDGVSGFRDGLKVIEHYMQQFWESLHPQLDPDDDNDPTIRANTLNGLCDTRIVDAIRHQPLVSERGLTVSYHEIALAKGEISLPEDSEEEVLGIAAINSVFEAVDVDKLRSVATAFSESLASAQAIESSMTDRVGAFDSCNLDNLTQALATVDKLLAGQLSKRTPAADPIAASPQTADDLPTGQTSANPSPSVSSPSVDGTIRSREDAIRAIDRICQYFERYEPSSPLPLLLRRAKRLSNKSFLEILKDISPEVVSQAEAMGGVDQEEDTMRSSHDTTEESSDSSVARNSPATDPGY